MLFLLKWFGLYPLELTDIPTSTCLPVLTPRWTVLYSILYYIKVCYLYEVEPFHGMCGCKTTLLQFRYDTGVRHLSGYGVIYQSLFGI